jgi:hypothetical protein
MLALFRVFRALVSLFRRNGGHKISRFAPKDDPAGPDSTPAQEKKPGLRRALSLEVGERW